MEDLQSGSLPELNTSRLKLRQLKTTDDNNIFRLRSAKDVLRFVNRSLCQNIDEARDFISKINARVATGETFYWALALKTNNEVVGTIMLWNIQKEDSRAEVGFELISDFQRKGFMQEALTAIIDFGFKTMKLHSIEAVVNPGNTSSIKVLEKCNFIREGYFKENVFYNESFQDTAVYSLLNTIEKK